MRAIRTAFLFAACLTAAPAFAQKDFEITADVQAQIDTWKQTVQTWADDQKLAAYVAEHNEKGPIEGMDNKQWKRTRRSSAQVKALQNNAAAKFLKKQAAETKGLVSEAFLNGSDGSKAAFLDKTSSYIHAGKGKFDTPFKTGRFWQGKPEFDESTQTYAVQIAVPVHKYASYDKDGKGQGKAERIGVLVVGLSLDKLVAAKPAK